ncbi:MAG: ATP-binding cassette domain-containing protein, partial [Streptomyces sp.]|uniref:ABC transporter ATP-binding protein n=1 Tax=Streptomyces sp. TaxID=1931 RepID=UPI0025CC08CD
MTTPVTLCGLTKQFGAVAALADVSVDFAPGEVTGFLGPNGAGKTTAMRLILGLARPSAGSALIGGRRYAELDRPRRIVGAVIETAGFHTGRTGRAHLSILALGAGVGAARVEEVLDVVELAGAADRRIGTYSLGMRQRLALAGALLGDPAVLLLDEPANGLDPEGIAWLRRTLRGLAGQGRTVVVSSHVLSEVGQ